VDVAAPGSLDGLAVVDDDRAHRPLLPGEVRIAVRAAGINFRDVVLALGLVPEHSMLGLEAAGVVTAVGEGVTGLAAGDRVMGLVRGGFAPVVVADQRTLLPIPAGWSYPEAAAVPLVFLTALYALQDLAALRPGESVLVHAAAGGVGSAATQLARHLGAEVFGTASQAKWDVLRGNGFDDEHIASSRSLEFEPAFLAATAGRGVDVVLNSLAGPYVDASLRLLPRGGRFVEMGKTDIRDAEQVAAAHAGVAYQAFDLLAVDPDRIAGLLARLRPLFDHGVLTPPPVATRDVRHAPAALRQLADGRTVGKLVLTVPRPLLPEGTALVTGGTGALGVLTARHLLRQHGIRHLLLTSRQGGDSPGAQQVAAELTELGATVTFAACDVADRDGMAEVLARVPAEHPLTAVVHTAGVLDDGPVQSLDGARLAGVLAPKVSGAWNLHELTRQDDLSAFVLFSSVSGVIGNAGQAGYAAANTFLDALSRHRAALGLPSASLAYSPWTGGGMAARLERVHLDRMARTGVLPITPEQGLELLESALRTGLPEVVAARLDLARLAARPAPEVPALLRGVVAGADRQPAARAAGTRPAGPGLAERLAGAEPADRHGLLLELVQGEAAAVLGHPGRSTVPPDRTFKDAGIDSLTAIELRNRLSAGTGLRLPSTLVFDRPTPAALAAFLYDELLPDREPAASPALAQLALLERAVLAAVPDAADFDLISGRLEELAARLRAASAPREDPAADVEGRIEAASDDEIFAFIDNELGEV
jgi:NADPH:quinone reductase-like Zn-dependent oxidoreductase